MLVASGLLLRFREKKVGYCFSQTSHREGTSAFDSGASVRFLRTPAFRSIEWSAPSIAARDNRYLDETSATRGPMVGGTVTIFSLIRLFTRSESCKTLFDLTAISTCLRSAEIDRRASDG